MDTTKDMAKAKAAGEDRPQPDEHARAAAYLDLWERHLVHAAVHGAPPTRGRSPA